MLVDVVPRADGEERLPHTLHLVVIKGLGFLAGRQKGTERYLGRQWRRRSSGNQVCRVICALPGPLLNSTLHESGPEEHTKTIRIDYAINNCPEPRPLASTHARQS